MVFGEQNFASSRWSAYQGRVVDSFEHKKQSIVKLKVLTSWDMTHVTWAMSKENFLYIENFLYLQKIFQKFDMKIRNFRLAGLQIFNKQENF